MMANTVIAADRFQRRVKRTGVEMAERTASPGSLVMREIVRHAPFICRFLDCGPVASQQNGEDERL
jgi:hypothetical protein